MNSTAALAQQVHDLLAVMPAVETLTDGGLRDELVACEQAAQMLLARQAEVMTSMGRRAEQADRVRSGPASAAVSSSPMRSP